MRWLNVLLILYAVLMLAGGVYGFVAKASVPSLVSSGAAAALIGVGLWVAVSNRSLGYGICAFVALGLALFFGLRVMAGHTMPGIPALVASIAALIALAVAHFTSK
jgi:uncharacterized membrane protein (UPF0136 family)